MEKSEKIILLSTIILVGFVLGIVYHYIMGGYLDYPYPFNTFLAYQGQVICDFKDTITHINDFAPYKEVTGWITYFPLAYLILFPFSLIKNSILAYSIFLSGFLIFFVYMNIKNFYLPNLSKLHNFHHLFIITFLAYPVIFIIDRGNFDMFLFVIFALFVYAFKQEKYFISALFLGILNAIKPFWIAFFLLFLIKKRFKEVLFSIILTSILIVGGFMIFKGNFFDQINTLITTWVKFRKDYIYFQHGWFDVDAGCSLFMGLKVLFYNVLKCMTMSTFLTFFNWFSLFFIGLTTFFVCREKVYWKQVTLLLLTIFILPFTTSYYKLIFLFVPLWMFFNVKEKSKFDWLYTVLFGLLLIPKNILIVNMFYFTTILSVPPGSSSWVTLSSAVIIDPIIMLLLFGLIIYDQFSIKQIKEN